AVAAELEKRGLRPTQSRGKISDDALSDWTPILPVPVDAPAPTFKHRDLGDPVDRWEYRNAEGQRLFYVCRFQTAKGKETRARTFCAHPDGRRKWQWRFPPRPYPLCGLEELAARPNDPVGVAEGEKARAAARRLFP